MQNLAVLSWNFAWMRELIQKMVSQPGKMPLYFWICNLPSFPSPPPLCPMRCTQRTRGCLAITSPAGPLGNGKATEKEQSKATQTPTFFVWHQKLLVSSGRKPSPSAKLQKRQQLRSCQAAVWKSGARRGFALQRNGYISARDPCVWSMTLSRILCSYPEEQSFGEVTKYSEIPGYWYEGK